MNNILCHILITAMAILMQELSCVILNILNEILTEIIAEHLKTITHHHINI
ncbi:MAG: hypothetical protein HDT23_05895 [Ruminococcus sp.]|nr:hypothetical protein [Ruminococcus sp.]